MAANGLYMDTQPRLVRTISSPIYTIMDDDLTASHWDDVLLPSSNFNSSTIPSHLGNQFADLSVDDSHDNYTNEQDQDESEEEDDQNDQNAYENHTSNTYEDPLHAGFGTSLAQQNQATLDQLHDLRKEERKEHRSALMSELTEGSAFDDMEASIASPTKIAPSDSLFGDKGKVLAESNASEHGPDLLLSPKRILLLKHSQFKAQRPRRYPLATVVKQLKEGTGDSDPLSAMVAKPPTEEPEAPRNAQERLSELMRESEAPLFNIKPASKEGNEVAKEQPTTASGKPKKRESSSPTEISVGNPVKVGDITTAHIVYSIESRNVQILPAGEALENRFTVTRRYRDFCWLYKQLQVSHPGRIIPPPPSKKTYIGRFNENFIENRRLSLEKMLQKISKVPSFNNDLSFVIFLTSQNFAHDSKERERTAPVSIEDSGENESDAALTVSIVTGSGTGGGFMSSLFSVSAKLPEPDVYFSKKKAYIEDLEHNLRTFHRSLELIAGQRIEIVGVTEEIATIIDELADLEILKNTTQLLKAFAEVHMKLKESLDRINLQDQLTLGLTIEEYLRIIGSVKYVLETRTKTYTQYYTFKQDLIKKEEALNKVSNKYKSSSEKMNMLKFEVDSLKKKTDHFEQSFNAISQTIKEEMENFELERVDDFRNSVEIFIESSIESQKEAIELWETFYERQHLAQV